MKRYLATSLAVAFAFGTVSSACIAGPSGEASIRVRYDDLDLSTPQGVTALHRRIERAVDETCARASGPAPGQQTDLGCRADAVAAALSHVPQAIAEQRLKRSLALAETKRR